MADYIKEKPHLKGNDFGSAPTRYANSCTVLSDLFKKYPWFMTSKDPDHCKTTPRWQDARACTAERESFERKSLRRTPI